MNNLLLKLVLVFSLLTSSFATDTDDVGLTVGVDFRTYESCLGVYRKGKAEMIPNDRGKIITPSWIHFHTLMTDRLFGDLFAGDEAVDKSHLFADIGTTVFGVKRFLGLNISEALGDYHFLTHFIKPNDHTNKTVLQLRGRDYFRGRDYLDFDYHPEHLAGLILSKLKESAERYLGSKVAGLVIGVPGVYGSTQRQAILDAITIAGFERYTFISDPMAIVLAYGVSRIQGKLVLVIDFGGSTLDISVLTCQDEHVIELGSGGSFNLGGQSVNMKLMLLIHQHVMNEKNFNPFHDLESILKAWNGCESAKIILSKRESTNIKLQLEDPSKVKYEISIDVLRSTLESLMKSEFDLIERMILDTLAKTGVDKQRIDLVIMTGGSSKIPKFKRLVSGIYQWKQLAYLKKEKSVAHGAAVFGGIINRKMNTKDIYLHEMTQWSVGVEVPLPVFKPLIEDNDRRPATKSILLDTKEEKLTVYERFSNGQGEYTHRLGSITLPKITGESSSVNVTVSVDPSGLIKVIQDGWKSDVRERLLHQTVVQDLKSLVGPKEEKKGQLDPIYFGDLEKHVSQGRLSGNAADNLKKTMNRKGQPQPHDEL